MRWNQDFFLPKGCFMKIHSSGAYLMLQNNHPQNVGILINASHRNNVGECYPVEEGNHAWMSLIPNQFVKNILFILKYILYFLYSNLETRFKQYASYCYYY